MWRSSIAGALALAVLAACGEGGSSSGAVRGSAAELEQLSPSTTLTVVPPSSTSTPTTNPTSFAGVTTTTRPTTTTIRPTATSTTVAGPRALSPPAAGTYRYDTSGATVVAGSTVAFPALTTLVVDAASGIRQHSTRNLRDAAGNGSATEFTLEYRPAGVFLMGLRVTIGFAGATNVRDLVPATPVLLLPTGARPGVHLEADLSAGGATARLVVDILREERLVIGGQAVDTLVMRAAVVLPPGDVTGRQELTVNVDPGSRLWVRERAVVDAAAVGGLFTLHSEYTATLQRLTP